MSGSRTGTARSPGTSRRSRGCSGRDPRGSHRCVRAGNRRALVGSSYYQVLYRGALGWGYRRRVAGFGRGRKSSRWCAVAQLCDRQIFFSLPGQSPCAKYPAILSRILELFKTSSSTGPSILSHHQGCEHPPKIQKHLITAGPTTFQNYRFFGLFGLFGISTLYSRSGELRIRRGGHRPFTLIGRYINEHSSPISKSSAGFERVLQSNSELLYSE
jgi:hypothetical protein